MSKIKYFKFLSNNVERIMKFDGEKTYGFVNGRWMIEDSLLYKINGRNPDPTLVEISENEASEIVGIKNGNKVIYYISFLIPIALIVAAFFVGSMAIDIYNRNKSEKELVNMSQEEVNRKILDSIILNAKEEDITSSFKEAQKLYKLIPFGGVEDSVYKDGVTTISDVEKSLLLSVALENVDFNSDSNYVRTYDTSLLINEVSKLYNGFAIYDLPISIYSMNSEYYCILDGSIYGCVLNENGKTYRSKEIVKVTENKSENVLYLYEASILVKDERMTAENKCYYELFRYSDARDSFMDCSNKSCMSLTNPLESYKYKAVIYKHTFKKDMNGSYYWYSTEYNSKV